MPVYLTRRQVAQRLGCTETYVTQMIQRGDLPALDFNVTGDR